MEHELLILPEHLISSPLFSGVRVTRHSVLYVCFVDRCLSFCTCSCGHCIVSSSIYGFVLPLWYCQALLNVFYPFSECRVWLFYKYYQTRHDVLSDKTDQYLNQNCIVNWLDVVKHPASNISCISISIVYAEIYILLDIVKYNHQGPSWPWSYGSWIYNYLLNQCISSLVLWVRISIRARCTTLCDKVCQWLATDRSFSPGTPVSSANKTDRHDT